MNDYEKALDLLRIFQKECVIGKVQYSWNKFSVDGEEFNIFYSEIFAPTLEIRRVGTHNSIDLNYNNDKKSYYIEDKKFITKNRAKTQLDCGIDFFIENYKKWASQFKTTEERVANLLLSNKSDLSYSMKGFERKIQTLSEEKNELTNEFNKIARIVNYKTSCNKCGKEITPSESRGMDIECVNCY